MPSHLWQARQAEIASDPDLRAAREREYQRQLRRTKKMQLENMLLRAKSRLLVMQIETRKARVRQLALQQPTLGWWYPSATIPFRPARITFERVQGKDSAAQARLLHLNFALFRRHEFPELGTHGPEHRLAAEFELASARHI